MFYKDSSPPTPILTTNGTSPETTISTFPASTGYFYVRIINYLYLRFNRNAKVDPVLKGTT